MDRKSHFQQTLWDLQRKLGQRALVPLSQLAQRGYLSTGFPEIDELLGVQGITMGNVIAVVGMPSSGVTSFSYSVMAEAQAQNRNVIAIDLGQTFDASSAIQWGVVPEYILLVRSYEVHDAVKYADVVRTVIQQLPQTLIVINATDIERNRALLPDLLPILFKLRGQLTKSDCAILVLLPHMPSHTLQAEFDTMLHFQRISWLTRYGDIDGYHSTVTLQKDRALNDERVTAVDIWLKGEPM